MNLRIFEGQSLFIFSYLWLIQFIFVEKIVRFAVTEFVKLYDELSICPISPQSPKCPYGQNI